MQGDKEMEKFVAHHSRSFLRISAMWQAMPDYHCGYQSHGLRLLYKKRPDIRKQEDVGAMFIRYVVNDADVDWASGEYFDMGNMVSQQRENSAMILYAPRLLHNEQISRWKSGWSDVVIMGKYADGTKSVDSEGGGNVLIALSHIEFVEQRTPDACWGREMGFDQNAVLSKFTGTVPAWAEYGTERSKILDEGTVQIITGDKPIDYFDEMVKAWYNAGGQEYVDQINEAYQAQQ